MIIYKIKYMIQKKSAIDGNKITYADIQKETGVSKVTLSKLANNNFNPTGGTIEKLCKYFDCTPNDLMELIPNKEA